MFLFAVSSYTREAGVRQLERTIGAVCRAAAVKVSSQTLLLIPQHRTTSCLHHHSTTLGMPHAGPWCVCVCACARACVCACVHKCVVSPSVLSQIAEQLGMTTSPATSESIVPWELPIVVSSEFLVDCLGVSLSGPSHVQCMCRYRQGCATRDSAA